MRKKLLITCCAFFIILMTLFSGCIPLSDEAQITYLINRYYYAINKQDWDKARSYCIDNSVPYNSVNTIENELTQFNLPAEDVSLDYSFYVKSIVISGNFATVDGFLTFTINTDELIQEGSGEKTFRVEKIDSEWKLY